jgi:phenylglyoxylate dehydrogenase epsilon subunit
MVSLHELLKEMIEKGASDLHITTGAAPMLPKVAGLTDVPFHVLRSMDDAINLRQAMGQARSAIVLGAGLIGMHAAVAVQAACVRKTTLNLIG